MDSLYRFSFVDLPIRGQWVRLDQSLQDAFKNKSYPQPVSGFLGEMFAAVAMISDNLKFAGAVALQSQGNGALLRTLAECSNRRNLRGIAHVREDFVLPPDPNNLAAWLGDGRLALSLIPEDRENMQTYQGQVELRDASLAINLQTYFTRSEQLDTKLYFGADATTVTGLLLQRLPEAPDAPDEMLERAEDAWDTLVTLTDTIRGEELAELNPEEMLRRLYYEYTVTVHSAQSMQYKCTCNQSKSDRTLATLPVAEMYELLEELGEITVDCEFCGQRYAYGQAEVDRIATTGGYWDTSKKVH